MWRVANKQIDVVLPLRRQLGWAETVCARVPLHACAREVLCELCTGWANVEPPGPVLLASWLVIRDIIKSSFDTDTVLHLLKLLCHPPPRTHTYTLWLAPATQPAKPPGPLPIAVYGASSIIRQQKEPSAHKNPSQLCAWHGGEYTAALWRQ